MATCDPTTQPTNGDVLHVLLGMEGDLREVDCLTRSVELMARPDNGADAAAFYTVAGLAAERLKAAQAAWNKAVVTAGGNRPLEESQPEGPQMTFRPDNAAIDNAVDAARADALLLECAFQQAIARQHEVWEMSKRGRIPGYHLFLLTTDQLDMLEYAVNRVFRSTTEAYEAIHGPDAR